MSTASTATVRLTRRGRLVLLAAVMLLLVMLGMLLGGATGSAADRHSRPTQRTLTVLPGETLWTVANRIAPHSDPRLVVSDIQSRNHLAGVRLVAGQQLLVPVVG